ncbi:MAG: heme A synthase [bacterium]|nr:heme A synthase [bacterium]
MVKNLHFWIGVTLVSLWIMIGLGGATRLTGSGLSMVDWHPITGWLPPLTTETWNQVFAAYRGSPEFHRVNWDMTLEGFKSIFWLEYTHRLWGRLMGIPLAWATILTFWRPDYKSFRSRMLLVWILAAAQGGMGWYMVKSGLILDPHVSPYRLCAHMILAVLILSLLVWTYCDLRQGKKSFWSLSLPAKGTLALVFITIAFGALVAGLKAGLIYNTFPLMNGGLWPEDIVAFTPLWRDILENPGTVQFIHRLLAVSTLGMMLYWGLSFSTQPAGPILIGVSLFQFTLGIATLLAQVPIALGVLHQLGGVLVLGALLNLLHTRAHQSQRGLSEVRSF